MTEKDLMERFPILKTIPTERKDQLLRYFETAPLALLEYFAVEALPADTIFVREGEKADAVYFVAKGALKAIDYRFPGVEYEFMQFNKVYAMGAVEILLERSFYLTTLKTTVDSILIRCPAIPFGQWLLQDLRALRYESKLMGEYLLEQDRMTRAFLFLSGPERLAQILIHRYEAGAKNGVLNTDGNQQILSNESGFNIKTVARGMKALSDEGLVSRKGRQLLITAEQYQGLKRLVGTVMEASET